MWGVPEIGVPPNHPIDRFSMEKIIHFWMSPSGWWF